MDALGYKFHNRAQLGETPSGCPQPLTVPPALRCFLLFYPWKLCLVLWHDETLFGLGQRESDSLFLQRLLSLSSLPVWEWGRTHNFPHISEG